jgi:N-sulfoglucosamine sulfohydrolase
VKHLALAVIAALTTVAHASGSDKPKPNIIVYLSDDHGQEFAGCYGNPVIKTPNIDALARQGTRFTNVFAASPTCSPSRAALYTGLYPARNGLMGNHTDCKPDVKSLPHYLKPLGYRVVIASKSDVRPKSAFPFEYITATLPKNPAIYRRYRSEGIDTKAIDQLLAEHAKEHRDQPLCLILGDNGPHVVWEPNKIYDPAKLPLLPIMVDTHKTRTALANYYQDITTVDGRVGEVMASVKKHGFEDNTLFIYTSDQGPEWPHCKWTVYDTGLKVPFIARWPGKVAAGAVSDAMISFVDVMPTFVALAGGDPLASLDGKSFADVLLGKTTKHDELIFASHTGDKDFNVFPQRCVRDRRYKFVLNWNPERTWTTHFTKVDGIPNSHKDVWDTWVTQAKTDPATAKLMNTIELHPAEELYDLQADPYELTSLHDKPELKPVMDRMRATLYGWMASQFDPAYNRR